MRCASGSDAPLTPKPRPYGVRAPASVWSRVPETPNRSPVLGSRLLENAGQRCGVEWMSKAQHEMLKSGIKPFLDLFRRRHIHVGGPFDLRGVSPDLVAPLVQDLRLMRIFLGRAQSVPHLSVFGDQLQRHLLAAATDEDRHRTRWPGLQLADPVLDTREGLFERPQTVPRLAELEAVLLVVTLEPPRSEAEN